MPRLVPAEEVAASPSMQDVIMLRVGLPAPTRMWWAIVLGGTTAEHDVCVCVGRHIHQPHVPRAL